MLFRSAAHKNGDNTSTILIHEGDLNALLAEGSEALGIKATNAYLANGCKITDIKYLQQDDHVFFAEDAEFIPPSKLNERSASVVSTLKVPARNYMIFYLNGKRVELHDADPDITLLEYLRSVGLTSVKKPCGEGGCGGCAVAVARYDRIRQRVHHFAVNSCLIPLPFIDGCSVTTAEGVGYGDHLHRIQQDLAKNHGTQCGFCSPGIVTTLYALFAENPERTLEEIDEALSTNICRCTGYRPIFDAARRYAIDYKKEALGNLMLEQNEDIEESIISTKEHPLVTAEFPEELINLKEEPVLLSTEENTWFTPSTLEQLSAIRHKDGKNALMVSGSSDLTFRQVYRPHLKFPLLISTANIKELKTITEKEDFVEFGSATSVNEFSEYWKKCNKPGQEELGKVFTSITKHFANYNIRNVGTIGGSLVAADALSDLCPMFVGTNSSCKIISQNGERIVPASEFILNHDLKPDEVLLSVLVPYKNENTIMKSLKIAKRREDSQALCNSCFNFEFVDGVVKSAHIVIGAVAPKVYICEDAEKYCVGKKWNFEMFKGALELIMSHLEVSSRVGHGELRKSLVEASFYKYYIIVAKKLGIEISEVMLSASEPFQRKERSSKQTWEHRDNKVLGKQNSHVSAYQHTSGEAKFVGDIAVPDGCLYAAPVQSTKANAKIKSIDPSPALAVKGVVAFVSAEDIPAMRKGSSIPPNDEDIFADGVVQYYGQIIGLIVADNDKVAHKSALLVKVTYEDEQPPIVTVKQAIQNAKEHNYDDKYFLFKNMGIQKGDAKHAKVESTISGETYFNNQEHFYLETNSMLVVPHQSDSLKIYAACQNPNKIQEIVSNCLGIPRNKIICEVMRLGGGFGGKQDRPQFYAAQAAVASHKLDRPIKYILYRQEDITTAGMRHEYQAEYKIGYDKEGKIQMFDVFYHSNGGWTKDLSGLVMDRSIYSAAGCYGIQDVSVDSYIYKTNKISCTAYRGFGVPQSLFTIETAMAHVAFELGVRPEVIKEKNLYHKGDKTLTGYELPDDHTRACWFACKKSCDWDARVKEVEEFNAKNVYKKRGIAMVPVVSTMGFESEFMMKGHALVQIYGDGSVSVSHGGIEMGQGVHTKMQMIAAETLGIDLSYVKVLPTATDKTVNMPPTAGSTGTDLHGGAVFRACKQLSENLKPIKDEHPEWDWKQICSYAYFNKYEMQASGFNPLPKSVYDHHTHEGRESYYLIWSVGFCEVEIDVLTGEHYIVRADLVHDCGSSLNPAIDIGQLEGGFVQGQGLYTLEDMIWDTRDGHIRTRNLTTYKIPTLDDIPDDFRVELLHDAYNHMGIYGSKASGEAGLRLGCSVIMALRDAITAARKQFGVSEWFDLDSPATIEKIRAAIPVQFLDPTKKE